MIRTLILAAMLAASVPAFAWECTCDGRLPWKFKPAEPAPSPLESQP